MGGDLFGAEDHFAAGLQFFDDPTIRRVPAASIIGIGVASWNAWLLGRADVARDREAQMTAAINGNNPYDVAYAGYLAARLQLYLRETEKAETLAARALELSEKNRLPYPTALSRIVLGQAQAELGHVREGIETIRLGIAGFLEAGARLGISMFTTYLATALRREGAFREALTTLEQALRSNPGELVCQPEILRLRGELRRINKDIGMAAADFREAIALARTMGARAWELRVTMSLARLLAKQGGRDEARTMLVEIYSWFTEGFDTADLKEAKTLLDELNG
jgi:tetratricopeptide (TPR) repeat protein